MVEVNRTRFNPSAPLDPNIVPRVPPPGRLPAVPSARRLPSTPGARALPSTPGARALPSTPGAFRSAGQQAQALEQSRQQLLAQLRPFDNNIPTPNLPLFAQGGQLQQGQIAADATRRAQQFGIPINADPTQGNLFGATAQGELDTVRDLLTGVVSGDFTQSDAFRAAIIDPVLSQLSVAGLGQSGAVGPAVAQALIPFVLQGAEQLAGIAAQDFGQQVAQRQQRQAELENAQQFGLGRQAQELAELGQFGNLLLGERGQAATELGQALQTELARSGLALEQLQNTQQFFGQQRAQDLGALSTLSDIDLAQRGLTQQDILQRGQLDLAQRGLTQQDILERGQLALAQRGLTQQDILQRGQLDLAQRGLTQQDILQRGQLDLQNRTQQAADLISRGQLDLGQRGLQLSNDIQRGELDISRTDQRLRDFIQRGQLGVEEFRANLDARVATGQLSLAERGQLLQENTTQFQTEFARATFAHQQDLDRITTQQQARRLDLDQLVANNQFALGSGQLALSGDQLALQAQAQQTAQTQQLLQQLLAAAGQERAGVETNIDQLTQLAERLLVGPFGSLAPGVIGQSVTQPGGASIGIPGIFGVAL